MIPKSCRLFGQDHATGHTADPEKLQTFRIRSCDRTNTWSEIAIQSERILLLVSRFRSSHHYAARSLAATLLPRVGRRLPQPALHPRLFADGDVEPHPRRAFEM